MAAVERRDATVIIAESKQVIADFEMLLEKLSGTIDELEAEARHQSESWNPEGRQ